MTQRIFFGRDSKSAWAAGIIFSALVLFLDPSSADPNTVNSYRDDNVRAVSTTAFLNSLGVDVHVSQGYNPDRYVEPLKYLGVRNIRDGAGRLASTLELTRQTGTKVDLLLWCNLPSEMAAAERLSAAGSLLAIEGPNEPNNFPIEYHGQKGGGHGSWLPIAECQKDIFETVKSNPALSGYPIFSVSEAGAETDNVGLQFLTIPPGAGTLMATGTQFANFANVHNYVSSNNASLYEDNQAWNAADPILNSWWDGLYGEYGRTWLRPGFQGYSNADLQNLPRVTTETGWDTSQNPGGQDVQGKVLVNTYLSQFKRGWAYTFIYELIDGEGSTGDQGLYTASMIPKLAANYIHNLTTILADQSAAKSLDSLIYSIASKPTTVHDFLLENGDGRFELVIWGEQVKGSNDIEINFGKSHKKVNIYDVTVGTKPIQTFGNANSTRLVINDHAMVIEIID